MTTFSLAVLLTLTAVPLQARPRAPRPGAEELLLKALAAPATSYAAVERVQVFFSGKKPKAVKVNIFALPDGRIRREVIPTKKKAVPFVQVRDREAAEAALSRLRGLYDLSVSTGGVVVKRKTWRINLHRKTGVLRRSLWVDRASGLLMKRETYRNDGSLARRERLVKLEMPAFVAPGSVKSTPERGPWAPDGFVFTGEGGGARHYSNGLESYSISEAEGKVVVSGDLAEDDAARVRETASR